MKTNPLLDVNFLIKLFSQRTQEKFVKIISLDFQENPVEEIQGRTSTGSINKDGSSAVRCTCSITLLAQELNIHDYYWGLNTKFKVYVGIKNNIDNNYSDIIWFPQGLFLITTFNTIQSTNSWQVTIQGKDKMALLNGDIGGNIMSASHNFGAIIRTTKTQNDDGTIEETKSTEPYLLSDIIREGVHEYAKEPYYNIIIDDLDDEIGLELLEYDGEKDTPLYLFYSEDTDVVMMYTVDDSCEVFLDEDGTESITIKELFASSDFIPYTRIDNDIVPTIIYSYPIENCIILSEENDNTEAENTEDSDMENEDEEELLEYRICKVEAGQTLGYRLTDLTYDGDLIASNGEAFTSVLDKIVNMLNSSFGGYEYFYNLEGQFVFQRKKDYVASSWNNITEIEDEEYVENSEYISDLSWSFENTELITSIQNTPNFSNIKNDYSIWGVKGEDTPIHVRYAIDKKPIYYKTYSGIEYTSNDYDWRELIFQMAYDYKHYGTMGEDGDNSNYDVNFTTTIKNNNLNYYPTGYTGYEQYYTDIYSFWRELYNPAVIGYKITGEITSQEIYDNNICYWFEACYKDDSFITNGKYYYKNTSSLEYEKLEIAEANFFPVGLYLLCSNQDSDNAYIPEDADTFLEDRDYYFPESENYYGSGNQKYWNKTVYKDPESLIFWFDFLDTDSNSDISKYEISRIGDRTKTENDEKLKSIYYLKTPSTIFYPENDEPDDYNTGYTYLAIDSDFFDNKLIKKSRGTSLKDRLDTLLYNYSYCADTINITCLPIYHLQPNTLIYVKDDKSGINGKYLIKTISIPLTYNGTSVISAVKQAEKIT